jgi:hypothetical protein
MVPVKNVVNREHEALTAEKRVPVIGEMNDVCVPREDRNVELFVADPAQARKEPTRTRRIVELPVFGIPKPLSGDDQLVARRKRRRNRPDETTHIRADSTGSALMNRKEDSQESAEA